MFMANKFFIQRSRKIALILVLWAFLAEPIWSDSGAKCPDDR